MSAVLTWRARGTSVGGKTCLKTAWGMLGTVSHGRDIQISGRTAVIRGVKALTARRSRRDLRGGAALCLAALAAQGESLVEGVELIDRDMTN